MTHSGTLPAGVSFNNNGNGTATFSGTPTAASGGTYPITFTAKNTAGTTTQSFVLTVDAAPAITSAASAHGHRRLPPSASPSRPPAARLPTLSESGALPAGPQLLDNGNGTATISGTPRVNGKGGVYKLTITATNSYGTATQSFSLTVVQAPVDHERLERPGDARQGFTFTFTSTGYPLANVTHTGTVKGLTYTNNGNGTATL